MNLMLLEAFPSGASVQMLLPRLSATKVKLAVQYPNINSYIPWIAGHKELRKAQHIGSLRRRFLDEVNHLIDGSLKVKPNRLGLDCGHLDVLAHFGLNLQSR